MTKVTASWMAAIMNMGKHPHLRRFLLFSAMVLVTRLPQAPQQLFSFDEVNFAYAIRDFDPRLSQPQPPGYPLFVLETRVLLWLGFKRAESNLLALAILAAITSLMLISVVGDRMFGRPAGMLAALLLLFDPAFWYTSLTSAVRVQLAVVSLAVGLLCYRLWRGEVRLATWSGVALGLGAGIRPELGPLLAPLWVASMARAGMRWRQMLVPLAVTSAAVLVWLVPTVIESGGPATYYRMCVTYARSEAGALTSGLFGASSRAWLAAACWLLVWLFSGAVLWPLAAMLAWRRGEGFGLRPGQARFFAVWFAPSFLFAAFFHVADPGHVQAMTVVVCLLVGGVLSRAATLLSVDASLERTALLAELPAALFVVPLAILWRQGWVWVGPGLAAAPFVCVAFGWLMRIAPGGGVAPRWLMAALLVFPMLAGRVFLFSFEPVYYTANDASVVQQLIQQTFAGLGFSSFPQIRGTVNQDDHAISSIRGLAAENENTVVVWKQGLTTWRKASYYLRDVTFLALEQKPGGPSAPFLARFIRDGRLERQVEAPSPIRVNLPAGARVLWLIDPKKPFYGALQDAFPLAAQGPVYYHDLPAGHGSKLVEDYLLQW